MTEIIHLRNHLERKPLTKETVTERPQIMIPLFIYMMQVYERQIMESLEETTTRHLPQEEPQNRRLPPFVPRLLSLFPNPSHKWRFIKIDAQNLRHFFSREYLPQLTRETNVRYIARCFFRYFDFTQFGLDSPAPSATITNANTSGLSRPRQKKKTKWINYEPSSSK
ncbi:hypothetical protein BDF20DRAFT_911710 [Mycotypha africana]|uniref:uncharacterized protein n=1 Tax=Mycotypha africana TaxID=64632 RepID=UPI002301A0BB|nr:uncharacterized protein BDF20DRAFT_911710 [Mycotypha africana]KAI8984633.1 hypothetical protein BDF20DRAFT_911710 [Mycotypha africana]